MDAGNLTMCVSLPHRMWRSDLPRGGCLLVSQSLDPEQPVPESGVRALMLTSQYLMEPCGLGRSRLTHICRADLRYQAPSAAALSPPLPRAIDPWGLGVRPSFLPPAQGSRAEPMAHACLLLPPQGPFS